jgi:malate dehydrogenase (oxaloacetate-decarboxylating)(NADP+)
MRAAFGLEGLLPLSVETIDQQQRRIVQQLGQKPTDLERYIFLSRFKPDSFLSRGDV